MLDKRSSGSAAVVGTGILLLLTGCSTGPQAPQVIGQISDPIAVNAVQLYAPKCEPAQYQIVARLDTSKLGVNSSHDFNMNWIAVLRKQAAGLGANGIILTPIGSIAQGTPGHGPGFKAAAIREPPAAAPAAGTSPWAASCAGLAVADMLRYKVAHRGPNPSRP